MIRPGSLIDLLMGVMAVLALVGGCLLILAPFVAPLLWAAIISFCSWNLYARLVLIMGGSKTGPALILVLCAFLCVAGPFSYAIGELAGRAGHLKEIADGLIQKGLPALPEWVATLPLAGERIASFWNDLTRGDVVFGDFMGSKLAAQLGQWLLTLGAATGAGLMQLILSILLTFFFYIGGEVALDWLLAATRRIAGERGPYLLALAGTTIKGVVYGILGTALVQSILAGLGFWMAGVPAAGMWGLATFFLSVIPMGPGLIWVPVALFLYAKGATGWAIFILVWGALVVGSVDNVIKPMLIKRGGQLPFIMVLLGVLGGAMAFGFLGVFIGPTLLAVGYSVLHDWTMNVGTEPNPATPL